MDSGREHREELITAAVQASRYAYAPYSNFPVGAAAYTVSGELITGANVENASYGLTLCAETSLVAELIKHTDTDGTKRPPTLASIAVVNPHGEVLLPCGRCRQVLSEFASEKTLLLTPTGFLPLAQLLPMAFGPKDLDVKTASTPESAGAATVREGQ
ncbi:cytidine deaminase [Micrococcoides hystricis]|uniref:Cytidine deaminase n=1 Tax=Micrococcoides hystricis TaxID=1572761 RepID=A0ABV6PAL1_9MICC